MIEVPDSALIPTLSLVHATVGSEKVEATHENVTAAPKTALCEEGEVVIPEKIVSYTFKSIKYFLYFQHHYYTNNLSYEYDFHLLLCCNNNMIISLIVLFIIKVPIKESHLYYKTQLGSGDNRSFLQ